MDWPFQEFCDSVATEKWIMQCLALNSHEDSPLLVKIAYGRDATCLPEVLEVRPSSEKTLLISSTAAETSDIFRHHELLGCGPLTSQGRPLAHRGRVYRQLQG